MFKQVGRFLIVLSIASLLGFSLYLAMHYVVQPIVARTDPEPIEQNSGQIVPRPIQLPSREEFVRGSFSGARNVAIFAVMTIVVVGIQRLLPKRRQKLE